MLFRALALHSDEVLTLTQHELTRSSTTLDSLSKQTLVRADTIGCPVKVMSAWLKQISHAACTYYDYLWFQHHGKKISPGFLLCLIKHSSN